MSILWEKLSGDTDRFAIKISFLRDPEGGAGATPEQSASWGAFQFWVGGQNLCAHREEGESVDSVHWYLLPFLEWIAENWDPLWHEERLPARNADSQAWSSLRATRFPPSGLREGEDESWSSEWNAWWARHSLQACREGGLFPDLSFRRWRDRLEISWGPAPIPGVPRGFRFTAPSGAARLEPWEVVEPLHDVLGDAVSYLVGCLPESVRVKALKKKIEALCTGAPESRLAWLAGLGETFQTALDRWHDLGRKFGAGGAGEAAFGAIRSPLVVQGSCHAALMFGSIAPSIEEEDVYFLVKQLVDLYSPDGDPPELKDRVREDPVLDRSERSWEQGYALAADLLEDLEIPVAETEWIDVKGVLDRLGIGEREIELRDASVRAVAVAGDQHRPTVLVNAVNPNNQRDGGHRFTLAHELCHILFDRSHGRKLALASGPWAPRDVEQRANAFAAMFLMPPQLIKNALATWSISLDSMQGVVDLARLLRTGVAATLEHVCNLGFIEERVRDEIRAHIVWNVTEGVGGGP